MAAGDIVVYYEVGTPPVWTNDTTLLARTTTASLKINATSLGFFGATPTTKPTAVGDPASAAATTQDTLTDSTGGAPGTTLAACTNTDALTDSSGGSANTVIAAITNAANAGSADVGPTADGFADIAAQLAKQRTLNGVLIDCIASLAAQLAKVKTDVAAVRTGSEANNTAIDSILARVRTLGLITT